jgi:hypothetical protein
MDLAGWESGIHGKARNNLVGCTVGEFGDLNSGYLAEPIREKSQKNENEDRFFHDC